MKIFAVIMSFKSNPKLLRVVTDSVYRLKNYIDLKGITVVDYGTPMNSLSILKHVYGDFIDILRLSYDPGLQFMRAIAVYYIVKRWRDVDAILFVDNDVVLIPKTFRYLFKVFEAHSDVGIASPILVYPDGRIQWISSLVDDTGFTIGEPAIFYRENDYYLTVYPMGAVFAIKTNVFRAIGYGTKSLPFWYEDVDIGLRTWRSGFKCIVVPKAIAIHFHGYTRKSTSIDRLKWYVVERKYARIKCVYRNFNLIDLIKTMVIQFLDYMRFDLKECLKNNLYSKLYCVYSAKALITVSRALDRVERVYIETHRTREFKELLTRALKYHLVLLTSSRYGRRLTEIRSRTRVFSMESR